MVPKCIQQKNFVMTSTSSADNGRKSGDTNGMIGRSTLANNSAKAKSSEESKSGERQQQLDSKLKETLE